MAARRSAPPTWNCSRSPITSASRVSTTLLVKRSLARQAMKPTISPAATTKAPIYASVKRNGVEPRSLVSAVTDHIPGSAHGMQQLLGKALVDLAPEPRDVHVDDVGLRVEVVVPHVLEQHGERDHLAGVLHEVLEQPELAWLQQDRLAGARHLVREAVEREVADDVARGLLFRRRPPRQCLDAGEQLGVGVGLGEVVVAAGAQAFDAVVD